MARLSAHPAAQTRKKPAPSGRPKYQDVYEALRQEISSGQYGPGARLPTEDALIEQFGVSRTTVIRALRDLQTEGLLRRRRGSGSFVPDAPVPLEMEFGLIWPQVEPGSIFIGVQQALAREAVALGWSLRSSDVPIRYGSTLEIAEVVRRMIEHPAQGLFFFPAAVSGGADHINPLVVELVNKLEIPMILLDRDVVAFPDRSRFDLVSCENRRGGFLLGRHLVQAGCKRILFVCCQAEFPTTQARFLGCQMAVSPQVEFRAAAGDLQTAGFFLQQVHDFQPDGVFCDNDHNAAMVLRYAMQAGISVPKQLKITGFDDTPTASLLPIALTTLRQPVEAIARRAVGLMRQRLERPATPACHVQIDGELIVRDSSGS